MRDKIVSSLPSDLEPGHVLAEVSFFCFSELHYLLTLNRYQLDGNV